MKLNNLTVLQDSCAAMCEVSILGKECFSCLIMEIFLSNLRSAIHETLSFCSGLLELVCVR